MNDRFFSCRPVASRWRFNEKALGDLKLFLLGVARDAQNFHAVLQRLRNGVQHVGGANEHYFRKIVFHVEIVIGEGVIQFGIENFHERCGRIAAEVSGHFVHFVKNEDWVNGAGLLHHLDDLARQRANVGAAMAANFSLVANAAQRNANKFAPGGVADGHGQRGFADARRPDEAQDGALGILDQLANGQKFEDAVFYLFEAVMFFVEDFFCGQNVANFLGFFLPGYSQQPIKIIAADGRLRGHGRHQFQALQLLDGLFVNFLGHAGGIDFLLQLVDFAFFAAAQFLLDGFELFVEVILFLRALHLALHAGIDVAIDVQLFEFDLENVADAVQALDGIDGFQQILFFVHRQLQICGYGVGQARRIIDARGGDHGVVIQALRKLDELFVQAGNLLNGLFHLGRRLHASIQQANGSAEKAFFRGDAQGARALHAFHQNFYVSVGQLYALHDIRERSYGVNLFRLGIVHRSVMLRGQENFLVAGQSFFKRTDAGFPADDERRHLLREDDHIAHRHHGYALHFLFFPIEHGAPEITSRE